MSGRKVQRTQDAIARARTIAKRIAQREDRRALEAIRAFEPKPRYKKHELCIAKRARLRRLKLREHLASSASIPKCAAALRQMGRKVVRCLVRGHRDRGAE